MRANIDIENCISCGLCVRACPEVFRMAGDDHAEVSMKDIPNSLGSKVIEAEKTCPTSAITVEH